MCNCFNKGKCNCYPTVKWVEYKIDAPNLMEVVETLPKVLKGKVKANTVVVRLPPGKCSHSRTVLTEWCAGIPHSRFSATTRKTSKTALVT